MAYFFNKPTTFFSLFIVSLVTFSSSAEAYELSFAKPATPYIGIDTEYNNISEGPSEYNPLSAKVRLGVFLLTNVALEASYATGFKEDTTEHSSEIEVETKTGLFLRFQSPIQQGIRLYLFGGYNTVTLSQTTLAGTTVEEEYDSTAWGLGLEEHFKILDKVIFFLEYGRPYDDEFRISHYSLGARYQF